MAKTPPALTTEQLARQIFDASKAARNGEQWHYIPDNDSELASTIANLAKSLPPQKAGDTMVQVSSSLLEQMQDTITNQKMEIARLNRLVMIDPLTGAHSLIALTERGQEHIAVIHPVSNPKRTEDKIAHGPVTLVVMDLDGFKQINDNCGHKKGDEALQDFADFMQSKMRPKDFFRKSGDEFVAFYHGTEEQAQEEMAKLRREFVEKGFEFNGKVLGGAQKDEIVAHAPVYLSFSFGTHLIDKSDANIAEALHKADEKAIADKATKKRRWETWERSMKKGANVIYLTESSVGRDTQERSA